MMKITIVYDNTAFRRDLKADWGFSCVVEAHDRTILFDTGAKGLILLNNMRELGINPADITDVFISHAHFDHTGGLADFLNINPVTVYIPRSCRKPAGAAEVITVKEPVKMYPDIFSTGELMNKEQSLVIKTDDGVAVVAGCSHPGVEAICAAALQRGPVYALIGGLHGFREFSLLEDVALVCPTHCTRFIPEIKARFPEKYVAGGAGKVIEV